MSRANPRFHRTNPPAPQVPVGSSVMRYRIQGSIEGQMTISSFDYIGPVASPNLTQLSTLLVNARAQLLSYYRACVSADWTVTNESINIVNRNDILGIVSVVSAGQAGGRAAGHVPTEVAQPLIKLTPLKGQHGRGRLSLPAIAVADVTASKISAAAELTNITTLETQMILNVSDGANQWTPCVSQRSTVAPKLVIGTSLLQAVTTSALLGTIRRRKIGRGR